ncbi:MAG: DinB family protein [Acidobacteria bacterium]|nr:DinB family protein [Acidobacteriota bacterium]
MLRKRQFTAKWHFARLPDRYILLRVTTVSSTQLEKFLSDLEDVSRLFGELVSSIPADRAVLRPDAASWSVADNIAHLSLTTEAFLPILEAAALDAKEKGVTGFGPFGMGIVSRVLLWLVDPWTGIRTKTKPAFEPVETGSAENEMQRFLELQARLAKTIALFDGLAIDKLKVVSPFASRVKYTVIGAFAIVCAHQRRHLLQAERAAAAIR